MKRIVTAAVGDPRNLTALLAARLAVSKETAAALVARGAVHVDGKRAREGTVAAGSKLVVYLEDAVAATAETFEVVHADAAILIVAKPAGMPSQGTRSDEAGALDALVQRLHPTARMMHRLDRDASGLVLFAVDEAVRVPLQAALENGAIDRRYVAEAAGRLDGEGRIALRIARDPADARRRMALPENASGGQAAASRWRAVAAGESSTHLMLTLETGRTHQLRVHLAAIGHPLVGDRLYGGRPSARLRLHAVEMELVHPLTGRRLSVTAPQPWPQS